MTVTKWTTAAELGDTEAPSGQARAAATALAAAALRREHTDPDYIPAQRDADLLMVLRAVGLAPGGEV